MPDEKLPTQATPSSQPAPAPEAAPASAGGAPAAPAPVAAPPRPTLAASIKAIVTSVPGMFTALAGSVAAITALVTALNNASWMRPATPTPTGAVAAAATAPSATDTIQAATLTPIPPTPEPSATLLSPSATPPSAPPAPTTLPAVLMETFGDPGSGWERHEGSDYACGYWDGGYYIRVTQPQEVVWVTAPGGRVFGDVSIEVDTRRVAGPEDNSFGIVARVAPGGRFYYLALSSDGYCIVQRCDGETWHDLTSWQSSPAIEPDGANRLRAELLGATLRFSVNGTLVAEVTDAALTEGEIGLAAGSFDVAGVEILFDNLRIEVIERL